MSKAKRIIEQYTYDIIECIYELKETVEKFSIDDIYENKYVQAFIDRNFQIIGEAISKIDHLDREILSKVKDDASYWEQIKGTRHIIVHEYFNTRTDILYEISKSELDELLTYVLQIRELSK